MYVCDQMCRQSDWLFSKELCGSLDFHFPVNNPVFSLDPCLTPVCVHLALLSFSSWRSKLTEKREPTCSRPRRFKRSEVMFSYWSCNLFCIFTLYIFILCMHASSYCYIMFAPCCTKHLQTLFECENFLCVECSVHKSWFLFCRWIKDTTLEKFSNTRLKCCAALSGFMSLFYLLRVDQTTGMLINALPHPPQLGVYITALR